MKPIDREKLMIRLKKQRNEYINLKDAARRNGSFGMDCFYAGGEQMCEELILELESGEFDAEELLNDGELIEILDALDSHICNFGGQEKSKIHNKIKHHLENKGFEFNDVD